VRWIGLSALLVAGLGVLAMAWIAVRDRTREIGTRRALGALASKLVADRAGLPFVFETGTAALALAAALLLNLLFASWPALRAARMDPIVAPRHE
jgi:putative ABC transport system permease protein